MLAARLQADPRTRNVSVLNVGIGGNKMLKDGSGQAALARLDRDVLAQPGVKTLVLLIGINDIGGLSREGEVTPEKRAAVVAGLIAGYRQLIVRAHERGSGWWARRSCRAGAPRFTAPTPTRTLIARP